MTALEGPIRVLHVDDQPEVLEASVSHLEREDDRFDVETATSAREGLERLAAVDFDCVVSDYDMPGRDGIEFLEAVRGEHPALPFILYVGDGSEEIASDAISAGVTDYLRKRPETGRYTVLADRIASAVEKRRARRVVGDAERKLSLLTENTDDVLFMFSGDWSELQFVNSAYEDVWGGSVAELESDPRSFMEYVHPEDRARVRRAMERLSSGQPDVVEYRVNRPDGERRWVQARANPVFDDGRVTRVVGFVRDVTEHKLRERALEELHETTREIVKTHTAAAAAEVVVEAVRDVLDMPANAVYLDEEAKDGLVPVAWTQRGEELVGEIPTIPRGEGLAWEVYETGEVQVHDDVSTAPGRLNPDTELRSELLLPLGDHGVLLVGSDEPDAFDETDVVLARTLAANALTTLDRIERERALQRYERIVNTMQEAACVYDEDGRFVVVNEHLAELYGTTRDALRGEPSRLVPRIEEAHEGDPYRELLDGQREEIRGEVAVDFDGHGRKVIEYRLTRLTVDGVTEGVVGVAHEVTHHKERERELQDRNERLEEFASIVSHDLRNPLNVAGGRLELAREECDCEHLDAVARALDRSQALVDDLLTLAREGNRTSEMEPVGLAEAVERCWRNVETAEATLVTDTDRVVRADRSRLAQLLENLVRNAVEHGSASGRPGTDDAVEHGGADVTVTVGDLDGGFYVEDDGPGIPEPERERVFEAGYSTADDGTGFGLNIVQEIAEAHGWAVSVTDGESGGARFELTGVEFV